MKKVHQLQLMLLAVVLVLSSCGGTTGKRVIKDDRLAGYMLAGVYTLTGYNRIRYIFL